MWVPGEHDRARSSEIDMLEVPCDARETDQRLVAGDALEVADALSREGLSHTVDLAYVDPPFASQTTYVHEARLDGRADGRVVRAQAYDDRWGESLAEYLDMLAPRLEALAGLLSPRGTLWVHVDWRASYLVRALCDEILGRDAFVNEIVWRRAPNLGRQAASRQFGRTLDTLVVYGGPEAKLSPPTRLEPIEPSAVRWDDAGRPFTTAPRGDYTDASMARLEKEGRVHRTASGKLYVKYFLVKNADGAWCRERRVDALWTDVPPLRHARTGERTGFPTQKPRALLDRIVACATPPDGLVVDLFAGSGTTGESAHALGRRFVLGDRSPIALSTARARLMRARVPLAVQSCGSLRAPAGKAPRLHLERDGGTLRVTLREPREPLAWAVGALAEGKGPLRVLWHSERAPGARPRPAERVAIVTPARAEHAGPLVARVWYDDGRVGQTRMDR
jgi:DNA modification methylase